MKPQPSTSKAQSEYDDFLACTAPRNISELKLMNGSFENLDQQEGTLTRSQSLQECMMRRKHMASSYKMLSFYCSVLANQLFATHADIQNQNSSRDGLAESLYLKSSSCDTITPLQTSKRLGGKDGGAYEVNRRSVLSSHQWGRAGLAKFCAGMELQLPRRHITSIRKK